METTIFLARILWPFILLVSLAALVMGMLNAKHVFGAPAMASSYFNLGSIVGGIALGWWFDPHFGSRSLIGLSLGTLVGGFWQLTAQFPALFRVGFRFRPDFNWKDEGVRTVLVLMGPAVVAASAVQVNVMVNTSFASKINGAVSWLNIAFRLMQLPLGMFGVAIGTVTLPLISRSAVAGNMDEFRSILARGMRLAFLLTIPSAVGLVLLSEPIISVLYQHGKYNAEMIGQTAAALRYYGFGLVAYSALKVLTPAFYAINKKKTPMMVSFLAIGTNLLMNWIFTVTLGWGHRGLAFSTSLVATINLLLLYVLMKKQVRGLETGRLMLALGKISLCSVPLALVCWGGITLGLANWASLNFLPKALLLFGTIVVGSGVFFSTAFFLRIEEVHDVARMARRKLKI
jgi:putative peptidoglycan lipid II flippase